MGVRRWGADRLPCALTDTLSPGKLMHGLAPLACPSASLSLSLSFSLSLSLPLSLSHSLSLSLSPCICLIQMSSGPSLCLFLSSSLSLHSLSLLCLSSVSHLHSHTLSLSLTLFHVWECMKMRLFEETGDGEFSGTALHLKTWPLRTRDRGLQQNCSHGLPLNRWWHTPCPS